jgi:hypothetical protein
LYNRPRLMSPNIVYRSLIRLLLTIRFNSIVVHKNLFHQITLLLFHLNFQFKFHCKKVLQISHNNGK